MKNIKNKIWLWLLIPSSFISIIIGIVIIFKYRNCNDPFFDSNFVGACFSLAGVLMFCAALIYQVKEYKAQVKELNNTSVALDEQKRIMLEQKEIMINQNINDYLFSIIENFNKFKAREEIQQSIKHYYTIFYSTFHNELNSGKYVEFDYKLFSSIFIESNNLSLKNNSYLQDYIQFAFNIFEIIENKTKYNEENRNFFKSFFFNQFIRKERTLLFMSNLISFGSPNTLSIRLNYNSLSNCINEIGLMNILEAYEFNKEEVFKEIINYEFK